MSDKKRNSILGIGVITVIFLIIITHSDDPQKKRFKFSNDSAPSFPVQQKPQRETMQALVSGVLELDGKCLKVGDNLIIWPYGYSIELASGHIIRVLNATGEVVASVGDSIKLSGGQVDENGPVLSSQRINLQDCKGPIWLAGEVMP